MFITDFKKEFYDVVLHQRVLVLVALDVDAICACRILQNMFQCDHVQYTLVPVSGRQDLEKAYLEHSEQIEYVVLINCGANIDILDTLQPEENVQFYICDSHRPIDLVNIYNETQIKLLMKKEDDFSNIPDYEKVFRDEESDDEDRDSGNESDGSAPSGKRRRLDEDALEQQIEKRRKLRMWEEERQDILFRYEEFSFHGTSSALVLFEELSWKMSKDTSELLWLAIVGLSSQIVIGKIERDKYVSDVDELNRHVSRHNHPLNDQDMAVSVDCLRIAFNRELRLSLYRHWSIFDSLFHSVYTACSFKVWTMKGKKKLHEFLADMGLPLVESKQKYTSMDMALRENLTDWINKSAEKYGLDDMFHPSFQAQYGFKNKFCATDFVYAVGAVLESADKNKSDEQKFLQAFDCLKRSNLDLLEIGLDTAKKQMTAILEQVRTLLDMNQVICAGPFLYAYVQSGSPDVQFFSRPICLILLARFTLEAYINVSKSKRAKTLPLVMSAPMDLERGTSIVVGIPPKREQEILTKNFFGRAFEQASEKTNCRTLLDNFDSSIIEIKTEDRSKFFDALISLLS
ncbi:cell division control protein 45 homolog [Saccoglossus kowalevskii]|uniref:Cell division control protein 45 homolog n=1 Tax=Saccoglossus kowalevskii TaxID=10224 RepID=A0ABM0GRX6_SACKO|nr:PREDICTED: cell division control protein 45 homolog [Saccoglossus kowalevskii]